MFIFLVPFSLAALIALCTIISRSAASARAEQAAARAASVAAAAAEEKASAAAVRKTEREREAAARHAAKLERANELREAAENRLAAERALKSLKASSPAPDPSRAVSSGKAFSGQVVAFTGSIPGIKRAEAIAEVKRQGGRAYNGDMHPDVTMIIVGNVRKETKKLQQAKAWGIKQVPASEWLRLCGAA